MPSRAPSPREPAVGQLRLRTLGETSLDLLTADGVASEHQEMSKSLALVTYLACAPTRKESRDHLVDLLWSDLEVSAGQHALRQHLWLLRSRFGDILTADRKNVARTGASIDFDRDALLAAAEQGRCESVVELYRGDFFLGFAAPGSNEFERWTELERARLRSVFVRCAGQLAREWLSAGRFRDGQALARRVRDAEPFAQHGWRLLIESHISGGDYLGASVEADAFEQMLANEEMEPEPASRGLITTAQRGSTATTEIAHAPFSDLVGRETEFGWLMKAWNAAASGRSTAVHIVAPAGFGKTRLLQDFRTRLASLRARVVAIRADAGSASIPLSFLSDLVSALAAIPGAGGVTPEVASVLVGLAPALSSTYPAARAQVGHADEPHVRRSAVRDLMTAIAEERPLAILIDDLHWSDPESTSLLAGAISALSKQQLLVVVAQRSATSIPNFRADAQQFALAPLSDSAIAALLANVASLPASEWSDGLAGELRRATGGAPLLIVETLQLAMQREVLSVANGEWRCRNAGALAELLRAGGAVRQRVERLGAHDAAVVRLLSVAQLPLPFDVLCAASRQPADELGAVLASLERLGLVRHSLDQWVIGHDEYAAAALALMTPDDARAVHSALGRSLRDSIEVTPRQRQLATQHLRLANEWETLHTNFERLACDSRRRGDRRSMLRLAAEFLGTDANDDASKRLVAGLPLDVRAGLITPQRKVAAACAIAAPIAALWLAFTQPAPQPRIPEYQVLAIVSDGGGGSLIRELPIAASAIQSDTTLVFPGFDATVSTRIAQTYNGPMPSPVNPDEWLTVHAVPDSGVTDLFIVNPTLRQERRLTFTRSDDTGPVWSPDGRRVVFATSRWLKFGRTSLAILDLGTNDVVRLTYGAGSDNGAFWSPDGSHIAFSRTVGDQDSHICTIFVDGTGEECHGVPLRSATIGWLSDSSLLVVVDFAEGFRGNVARHRQRRAPPHRPYQQRALPLAGRPVVGVRLSC